MAERYYLGADGGGTKTTVRVSDSKGKIVAEVVGGSINFYSEGMERARENMANIIAELKVNNPDIEIYSAFIGMSALYKRATEKECADFFTGVIDAPYAFMDSDLFIALEAMGLEGECAVMICGTGSMIAGRKKDGSIIVKGGYGYILGDEGSGYNLGLAGIKRGVAAFEGAKSPTALVDAIREYYKVEDLHELIDIFYDPPMERSAIADFARVVFKCAESGDKAAIELVKFEAEEAALTAAALLREFDEPISLGVYGGMFQHHKIYTDFFTDKLNSIIATKEIKLLPMPPVNGAILAALRESGTEITDEILNNLKEAK